MKKKTQFHFVNDQNFHTNTIVKELVWFKNKVFEWRV
jgi:hypothetical protein